MKKTFFTEFSYVLGVLILAFGTSLMESANFGMSMVVAPAYILHLKISEYYSFFTFGMAEYTLQFFLIIITALIVRKFKKGYVFSFITAVIYGFALDMFIFFVSFIPNESFVIRSILFTIGMVLCSIGVAFIFHTYFSPAAYELMVKEFSQFFKKSITITKTVYDMTCLIISVILSFVFFGWLHFEGVNFGTLITTLVNGFLIGKISGFLESKFEFKDLFKFRKFFEE